MQLRYMRIVLFFDLPVKTSDDKREYRFFHKFLIKNGFTPIQYSVYAKLAINKTVSSATIDHVKKHLPPKGSIMLFELTEKQFADRKTLLGDDYNDVLNDTSRLIIFEENEDPWKK